MKLELVLCNSSKITATKTEWQPDIGLILNFILIPYWLFFKILSGIYKNRIKFLNSFITFRTSYRLLYMMHICIYCCLIKLYFSFLNHIIQRPCVWIICLWVPSLWVICLWVIYLGVICLWVLWIDIIRNIDFKQNLLIQLWLGWTIGRQNTKYVQTVTLII